MIMLLPHPGCRQEKERYFGPMNCSARAIFCGRWRVICTFISSAVYTFRSTCFSLRPIQDHICHLNALFTLFFIYLHLHCLLFIYIYLHFFKMSFKEQISTAQIFYHKADEIYHYFSITDFKKLINRNLPVKFCYC